MNDQIPKLLAWLYQIASLHPDIKPIPVTVKIADETWQGVRYTTRLCYTAGMDACTRGIRKPGETYDTEGVMCLGERPRVNQRPSRRPSHVCYRHANGQDWYLACYAGAEHLKGMKPDMLKHHPFGPNFQVSPWTHIEAIDACYWKKPKRPWLQPTHDPYLRYPIEINAL